MNENTKTSGRYVTIGILSIIFMVLVAIAVPNLVETLDAQEIMVIQYPMGDLEVFTEQGPKAQWFGKVTKYPLRKQYAFCSTVDAATKEETICAGPNVSSTAKRIRFAEGGHALLNGAVSWEMPLDVPSIIQIHKKFGSEMAIESTAIGKMIDSAVYFSGPLMTSTESSGPRRGELVQYLSDQAENGIYVTESKQMIIKDAAGINQTVSITEIIRDKSNLPRRQQGSILSEFKIKLLPLSINELKYDSIVEAQIAARQKSTTDVQLAMAASLTAEQDVKTAEAKGRASATQAEWAQKTIAATVTTKAQQDLDVATLAAKEAEQYKRQQILIGEGNSTKARLEMQANGALEPKLEAWVKVNGMYAEAIAKHQGALVPSTVIGGDGAKGLNNVQNILDMIQVKTAKEIDLDTKVRK